MSACEKKMALETRVGKVFQDLFPLNRSLTGRGVEETFQYIKDNFLTNAIVKSLSSGSKVFDWKVPEEWNIKDAYVLNGSGDKIIDFNECNLHVVSYSTSINKTVNADELLNHLHTLPNYPQRIPYRTSYYSKDWGFCCAHHLISSNKFFGPFKVYIDATHNENGKLSWLECVKHGETSDEILISTYCCHPSLANDNLSGIALAIFLFEYLNSLNTRFTYRLVIVPETIGAICYLSQCSADLIKGGMVLSCVAGPDKISIKEGFDRNHFMNKAAHLALRKCVDKEYTTYPFVPDGSDERQYSTPGFRIVTPSIHKSKYYEYNEYHTSADNLDYISVDSFLEVLDAHKEWINLLESYSYPKRKELHCEIQLGKRGLYPAIGGTLNQKSHSENSAGNHQRKFNFSTEVTLTGAHLEVFHWLMHLADGTHSNFEIAAKAGIDISTVNEAIDAMIQKEILYLL